MLLSSGASAQTDWRNIRTVEDVCNLYGMRVDVLLKSMDLARPGLEGVRTAFDRGDRVGASKELLRYYREGNSAPYLRKDNPTPGNSRDAAADSIVNNIFTFYELPDEVPLLSNGQLDWAHSGPDHDIEWAWGLNRHYHILMLLDAYFSTGNPVYAETIDRHLRDWVISSLPYPGVKSSTALWRGLEVSFRVKVWPRVFFGLLNSGHLTPATQLLMLTSLPDHTHYLRNFHAPAGNWLTMEMSGLATVATAWREFNDSDSWMVYAKAQMEEGLKDQVYPDGVQKELTAHYHIVALNNFKLFQEICNQAGETLSEGYTAMLEKMHDYIAATMQPTGHGILNNDSDKRNNRELILAAAGEYGREDWLYIGTNGKKGKRPAGEPSRVYPWAGQVLMRSGYDEDAHWSFFDIGPWGTGHQHNDKLHLSVAAYGRDLLVDGGRFAYRGAFADRFRRYATGSFSHNVVLLDGAGQDAGPRETEEPVGENHFEVTDRFDYAWGDFDRFRDLEGEAKHTRSVFYVRGKFWIVVDRIDTDRPRRVEALWHWHPGTKVTLKENNVVATGNDKGNLQIIPVGFDQWNVDHMKGQDNPVPQGWYSERYNKAEPAEVSVYSTDIQSGATFVWVLYPSAGKASVPMTSVVSAVDDIITVRVMDERSNRWDVVVPVSDSRRASYTFVSGNEKKLSPDVGTATPAEVEALLSRLNLGHPGLEKVPSVANDPAKAAEALLAYYRARTSVKHPIDRSLRSQARGQYASERDLRVADDALGHVFVGQSAYPSYYCGDDIDWGSRPVPDREWVWQLNRMSFWEAMGKAYWHTGDEKYAREWCLQLVDWTQKNPRDEAHAYAWRSIEAGIRAHLWMNHFYRFLDAPSFTPAVLVSFLNSCYDHASYLMTQYRKGSNWGLMEAEGMAFIAITFPEFTASEKWRQEAISRLNREIENQVYADGHQRELAMGYHTGSIQWFRRTLELARLNGLNDAFPASYIERIERMCEVPFKLGFPDGTTTQFGDSWTGSPGHTWPSLREWSKLFDRDDFLYVATEGREGRKPSQTAFALEHSGFYSMRSDWSKDAVMFVLKCGPDGGGHCQPDNGTFELYAGGRHLMPDAGSFIYGSDPENRNWFRQTKVHQTLTLNGENSRYAPKLLLWKPGKKHDVLVVENESYPDLKHRRAVFFVDKEYFVIVDEAMGDALGDVDVHFQLAPGDAVFDSLRFSVRTDFRAGWNVQVRSMPQKGMKLEEEEGWVSFIYTQKERRPAFAYRINKSAPEGIRFITVVAPYPGTIPPDISVSVPANEPVGASTLNLRIQADGVTTKVGYKLAPTPQ